MKRELLNLLEAELNSGENPRRVLSEACRDNGMPDVDHATMEQRRNLAYILKDKFQYVSATKRNMILSKLLQIMQVDVDSVIHRTLKVNEKHRLMMQQKVYVQDFWKKVDRSLMKFELIFNMFWLRAGEAEIRGMSHEEVMKITHKSMSGIKEELENAYKELQKQFDIKIEDHDGEKRVYFGTHAKLHQDNSISEDQKRIIILFKDFWNLINVNYDRFESLFFDSLTEDIAIRKQGGDDSEYVNKVISELSKIWKDIENGYNILTTELEKYHKKFVDP